MEWGSGAMGAVSTVERAVISNDSCSRWRLRMCFALPKLSTSPFREAPGIVDTSKLMSCWPKWPPGFRQSDITLCRTGDA